MQSKKKGSFAGLVGRIIFVCLVLFSFSGLAAKHPGPVDAQAKAFAVQSPNYQGELIVFHYVCPYPGVTKVKLFDSNGELLWRAQYNDNEGDNEVKFRSSLLESGTYVFKFEYKLESVLRSVSIP